MAQKVANHLASFGKKICCQELPEFVQSGHTGLIETIQDLTYFHDNQRQCGFQLEVS